jgi:hypothetical protein
MKNQLRSIRNMILRATHVANYVRASEPRSKPQPCCATLQLPLVRHVLQTPSGAETFGTGLWYAVTPGCLQRLDRRPPYTSHHLVMCLYLVKAGL